MTPPGQANIISPQSGTRSPDSGRIVDKGEMARLVRSYHWASTPLGPLDRWSNEMVAVVNLILCSPTPARLLWGPDLVLIYNDSYRSVPGRQHPDALGQPAREVFK